MHSSFDILYEDEHLVVMDKPAWSVIHPTRGADDAIVVVNTLAEQLGVPVYPVHRLDRQTSGVLLLAKNPEAARALSVEIREGRMHKIYLGLCRGVIKESLRVDHPVRDEGVRRSASTDIDPLEQFCNRYTLVCAKPLTGRRHQIRYHLKHVHHPLVGDVGYGHGDINRFFRSTFGLSRFFLHAQSLRILHPCHLQYLELSSPLPADLAEVLDKLRAYSGPVV